MSDKIKLTGLIPHRSSNKINEKNKLILCENRLLTDKLIVGLFVNPNLTDSCFSNNNLLQSS